LLLTRMYRVSGEVNEKWKRHRERFGKRGGGGKQLTALVGQTPRRKVPSSSLEVQCIE